MQGDTTHQVHSPGHEGTVTRGEHINSLTTSSVSLTTGLLGTAVVVISQSTVQTDKGVVICGVKPCGVYEVQLVTEANMLSKITSIMPSTMLSKDMVHEFAHLQLVDPHFHVPEPTDILIGADNEALDHARQTCGPIYDFVRPTELITTQRPIEQALMSDYPVAMSFSWFGGRKKSLDGENSEGENSNADVNDQDDTFVFIERKQNLPPNNSEMYPNLLPYPLAPTTATQPQSNERDSNTTGNIQTQNFLSGVPFKLSSSALYNLQPSTFEADQASQLLERLKVAEFDYDFSVENSVLMEESSKDLD
uniref:UMA domain-containing protein n=1 Tax=Timema cristinae TaxID=61476 RepID=A0A7R9H107_TIMCR|nr:unnamed protein product [Timema cristinae]